MKKIAFILILSIVLVSGCVGQQQEKPLVYSKDFFGYTHNFRANLTEAGRTMVFPNDNDVGRVLLHSNLTKVRVAYIPNDTESIENAYLFAATYEASYKLTITYKEFFGEPLAIEPLRVSSREEAVKLSKLNEPVLLILGPSQSNKTAVRKYSDYVVIAEGADISEVDRKYNDIDLAVDKLLLVVMQRAEDIIKLTTTGKADIRPEVYVPGEGYVPIE